MAYLFTQEINPFQPRTICYTALLVAFFKKQKWTQASLVSPRGPAVEAGSLTQVRETEIQLEYNLLQVSPRRGAVLILALTPSPYQQILAFFFSQTCWLRISLENGGRRRGKKRKGGGRKQPPGWRKILYVCALKHKVCGQLLKDFSGELRLSTESIE